MNKTYIRKTNEATNYIGGVDFLPLTFETYGLFHPSVKKLLKALAGKISDNIGIPKSIVVNCWTNRLNTILLIGEANMINFRLERNIAAANFDHYVNRPEYLEYTDI